MALFNKCFDNMIAATAALAPLATGENGSWEHTQASVGDARVGLFFGLVRDTPRERIASLFADCVGQARSLIVKGKKDEAAALVGDLFILAFQTRDCRGGKGERVLFYALLQELYRVYPETVGRLLPLIPEYGYFKDFTQLVTFLAQSENMDAALPFQRQIMSEMARVLKRDAQTFDEGIAVGKTVADISLSLAAKYAPREGKAFEKSFKDLFRFLVEQMFPVNIADDHPKVLYRRLLAKITPAVETVETKMCGKRFADIAFDAVPSVATKKYRKAFLNEALLVDCLEGELETGNRHPDLPDRAQCRQHFIDHIMTGEVKGKQLFPHEIVREFMKLPAPPSRRPVAAGRGGPIAAGRGGSAGRGRGRGIVRPSTTGSKTMSSIEKHMLCAQWKSLREHIVSTLQTKRQQGTAPAIDLGRLVPLVDVSGSMEGIPMEVAIAMGILVSEINDVTFRHRFLTFESKPRWVQLNDTMTLEEKVRTTKNAPWGGSTNFYAAMQLIATVVETHRLPMEEVPDLIVFSDMQFDDAGLHGRGRATQLQLIQQLFYDVGMRVANQPYPAPRIIFWNLRGGPTGFPAVSSEDNVQMLSGYSPSLFKFVVEGEEVAADDDNTAMDAEEEELPAASVPTSHRPTPAVPAPKKQIDPYATLRKVLDDERYFPVREVLSASTENELAWYQFTRPV